MAVATSEESFSSSSRSQLGPRSAKSERSTPAEHRASGLQRRELPRRVLEALLGQSYEDFELIISDNASTDGTADICRRYEKQDSRIRYVRQPHNIGLFPNHNFVSGSRVANYSSGRPLTTCTLATCCGAASTHLTSTRT